MNHFALIDSTREFSEFRDAEHQFEQDGYRDSGLILEDQHAMQCIEKRTSETAIKSILNTLGFYLAGFGYAEIEIKERRPENPDEPPARLTVSDGVLLFPERYPTIDGISQEDIYLAATAHAMAHFRHSRRHAPVGKRRPLLLAVLGLIEDARIERLMVQEFPGLHSLWGRFHTACGGLRDLEVASLTARLSRALHDPGFEDPNHLVNKGRDLFEAAAHRLHDASAFVEVASILANDLGQMRVRFDPESYRVEPAYRDDNTVLWDFSQDRQGMPADEILARHSLQLDAGAGQTEDVLHVAPENVPERKIIHYPEWDYRTEAERDRWATVIENGNPIRDAGQYAKSMTICRPLLPINDIRRRVLDRTIRLRRQSEGDDLDLNAAIEGRISALTDTCPDPRIFLRPGRRPRDHAVLVLLDLSESTNDRIAGTFTSVLDMEKQAAQMAAAAADDRRLQIALHGFASNGRHEVGYSRIKDFDEPFGTECEERLMGLRGQLSTRMGAALRHAARCLKERDVERKIILVVTDGEPSDIDVDDQRYLVEDARHAVATIKGKGIETACLTLDRHADGYVRAIFGAWNYVIVDHAASLPRQLSRALARASMR